MQRLLTVFFEKGKKWCFEKARSILEKAFENSSAKVQMTYEIRNRMPVEQREK